jgi:hypothetical protein
MPSDEMMKEVWRWKEEVARETAGMTAREQIAFFSQSVQRLAEKTGEGKLNLRRRVRPQRQHQEDGP